MSKQIINCETGEVIERNLTAEELAQQAKDEAKLAAKEAELAAKEQARQALLGRLGITEDEAKLLLGGN